MSQKRTPTHELVQIYPQSWDGVLVRNRLREAFDIERRLPGSRRNYSAWPFPALERIAMMNWQTLDNAPKDGSMFLANTSDFEHGKAFNRCVQEARWIGKTPDDPIGHFASKNGQMVTHWMPLPDDPLRPNIHKRGGET